MTALSQPSRDPRRLSPSSAQRVRPPCEQLWLPTCDRPQPGRN